MKSDPSSAPGQRLGTEPSSLPQDRAQRRWWIGAALVALAATVAATGWYVHQRQQRADARQQAHERLATAEQMRNLAQASAYAAEIEAAGSLCAGGDRETAWGTFDDLWLRAPSPSAKAAAQSAQAECGMAWLRELEISGYEKYVGIAQVVMPVLGRELGSAQEGARRGDLEAHLGWADFLRSPNGRPTAAAFAHYRRAVEADAQNPYANAMWAHNAAQRGDSDDAVAARFDTALASGRETAFVRWMQIVVANGDMARLARVIRSFNDARKRGEARPHGAELLYPLLCEQGMMRPEHRPALLNALSAEDAIATIEWVQPHETVRDEREPLWHLCGSAYLVHAHRYGEAEVAIRRALKLMGSAYKGGSWERWAMEQLARIKAGK